MRVRKHFFLALLLVSIARIGHAQVFAMVRVVVRDPQNLAIANSDVTIKAKGSTWSQMAKTNAQGEAVPNIVEQQTSGIDDNTRTTDGFSPPPQNLWVADQSF